MTLYFKTCIILVLCLCEVGFGQNAYYKSARIVRTDSGIMDGYVQKASESELSLRVRFKKSLEDTLAPTIPINDIDHIVFTADSSVFYKVKYVRVTDSKTTVDYRLAKKLLDGYAQLYKLQLPREEIHIVFVSTNTFVYVIKIDTNYYVLNQEEKQDTSKSEGMFYAYTYKLYKNYITVLDKLLNPDEIHKRRLRKLQFRDDEIIPLIEKLNSAHPEVPSAVLFRKEHPIIHHSINASFITPILGFGPGYEIGYAAKICYPNLNERFTTDIGIYFISLSNTPFTNTQDSSNMGIKIPLMLTYHFNDKNLSPYAGLGISLFNSIFLFKSAVGLTIDKTLSIGVSLENLFPISFFYGIYSLNISYDFAITGVNKKRNEL